MLGLNEIKNHLPPDIYEANVDTIRFLEIIQKMIEFKDSEVVNYADSFDPQLNTKIENLRRFIDDFGGEYLLSTTKAALECLYFNKYGIFSRKGTDSGVIQLIYCLSQSQVINAVTLTYTPPLPLLHFFTLDGGMLPNGQSLADELSLVPPYDVTPLYIPTLLDDSWLPYHTTITVDIQGSIDTSSTFTEFIQRIIPLYCWYMSVESTTINVNYIP